MAEIAIRAEGISKRYRLGTGSARYGRLSEALWNTLRRPLARQSRDEGELWALKDVSMEIREGEVIGIIGRNGSGKTTLLKVLSRITEPTEGFADVHGRVGSLLEVGTGFHPELTGRENVFLNGAILGMRKAEVTGKFDEIVAFAEIERFIDTPVKRYSSGMFVRLAFAVAAHLEPEILLVDEVLAVGDAAFQRKCLGKIDDVAKQGRTVLFVSHNMAAVESLCSRAVLLRNGRVELKGSAVEVVGRYMTDAGASTPLVRFPDETPRQGTGRGRITELRLRGSEVKGDLRVKTGGPLAATIAFESLDHEGSVGAGILIRDRFERFLCDIRSIHSGKRFAVAPDSCYLFEARIGSLELYPGEYTMGVWVAGAADEDVDYIPDACHLVVEDDGALLSEGRLDPKWGQFFVPSEWTIRDA